MVAKIADLGVARLIPEAAIPLTKGPGNAAYMPPEAQGGDYNKSLDVFSFGVLCLFTLTQTFPQPLPVKYQQNNQTLFRTEAQRRSTFLEQLRNEVKEQGWLVHVIQQCLSDNPGERPKTQEMLTLLESAATETSGDHMEKSKLELVQTIESEKTQHAAQIQSEEELRLAMEREFAQSMEENEREYRLSIMKKERELVDVIAQMKQEKYEAVQERERKIVEELTGIIGDDTDISGAITWAEGAGGVEMNKDKTKVS